MQKTISKLLKTIEMAKHDWLDPLYKAGMID